MGYDFRSAWGSRPIRNMRRCAPLRYRMISPANHPWWASRSENGSFENKKYFYLECWLTYDPDRVPKWKRANSHSGCNTFAYLSEWTKERSTLHWEEWLRAYRWDGEVWGWLLFFVRREPPWYGSRIRCVGYRSWDSFCVSGGYWDDIIDTYECISFLEFRCTAPALGAVPENSYSLCSRIVWIWSDSISIWIYRNRSPFARTNNFSVAFS